MGQTELSWFPLYPFRIQNSDACRAMSAEEFGVYMRLLIASWATVKDASLSDSPALLAKLAEVPAVSELVLAQFPVVETPWGLRRRNAVLYGLWIQATGKSVARAEAANKRWDNEKTKAVESSTSAVQPPIPMHLQPNANVMQLHSKRNAEIEREVEIEEEVEAEKPAAAVAGIQPGEAGYFEEGQYPAGNKHPEKAIFQHFANAWEKILGESAPPLRYPRKFPEDWELMCRQKKSGDVLVPAFELWVVKEGHGLVKNNTFVLSAFLRVASEYMAQVKPLNAAGGKAEPVLKSYEEILAARPDVAAAVAAQEQEIRDSNARILQGAADIEKQGEEDMEFYFGPEEPPTETKS